MTAILSRVSRTGLIALASGVLLAACESSDDGRAAAPTSTATAATPGESDAAPSAGASRGVRLQSIGRFDAPLFVTAPPGDRRRVFVVEQGGRVMVLVGGRKHATPSPPS